MEEQYINQGKAEAAAIVVCEDEQEDAIDLIELFYFVWGHIVQIIVCALVGGILAFGATYFLMIPQYSATAKMYVVSASNNSIVNLNDLQLGTQLTADYKELLLSRPLLEDVIEVLQLEQIPEKKSILVQTLENLGWSITDSSDNTSEDMWERLKENISIENPVDTRILSITVTNPQPEMAAAIANEIARQAAIYLPRIMEGPTPNIYEEAIIPTDKTSPRYAVNTVIGGFVLAMIYCGVILVGYLLNDSFTTPEDITRVFGVQPLAIVPEGVFKDSKWKHIKRTDSGIIKSTADERRGVSSI